MNLTIDSENNKNAPRSASLQSDNTTNTAIQDFSIDESEYQEETTFNLKIGQTMNVTMLEDQPEEKATKSDQCKQLFQNTSLFYIRYGMFLKGITKHVSLISQIFSLVAVVSIIMLLEMHFQLVGQVNSCCDNYILKLHNNTLKDLNILTPNGAGSYIDFPISTKFSLDAKH